VDVSQTGDGSACSCGCDSVSVAFNGLKVNVPTEDTYNSQPALELRPDGDDKKEEIKEPKEAPTETEKEEPKEEEVGEEKEEKDED
jgi:hypothetical protein